MIKYFLIMFMVVVRQLLCMKLQYENILGMVNTYKGNEYK